MKSETHYTRVGVLSKKDVSKTGQSVKEIMTSPPIAARPDNKVADAACLMLKHKVNVSPFLTKAALLVAVRLSIVKGAAPRKNCCKRSDPFKGIKVECELLLVSVLEVASCCLCLGSQNISSPGQSSAFKGRAI